MNDRPPLRPLHPEATLVATKLATFRMMTTEALIASLRPGGAHALKARPDGTMLDGHHRIVVLRERGVDCDALEREVVHPGEG